MAQATFVAATQPQLDQIDQLRQQLTLPEEAIENQCYTDFGCCIDDLSFGEAERMIAMLSGWVREYGEMGRSPSHQRQHAAFHSWSCATGSTT